MAEIDTLQVKITANATTATTALNSLANALKKVKQQLTGMKDGVSVSDRLSKSLNEMNSALNTINTSSIKKLQKLANALNDYSDAVKRIKGAGSAVSNIKNVEKALSVKSDTAASTGDKSDVDQFKDDVKDADDVIDAHWKKVKKVQTAWGKFFSSIKRIAFYRAIRSAMRAISEAFSEGLKNAYYFSQQNGNMSKLASTLDRMKSITSQMTNQLGALAGEIIQFIMPAIEWLVEKVRYIAEKATEFFAALNGDTVYKRAKYEEVKWDDAVDALKEYKHQLLGLDEINNLSKNKDSSKQDKVKDAADDYDYIDISPKMKKIGERWQELKKKIDKTLKDIKDGVLGKIGMLAIGTILLFTTKKLLGLGLIIGSGLLIAQEYGFDWEALYKDIKSAFKKYRKLITTVAVGMAAIGTILLFVPTKRLVGLTMIIESGVLMAANIAFNGEDLYKDIKAMFKKYKNLISKVAVGMAALGIILLFIPSQRGKGIGLLIASGVITVSEYVFNWDDILENLQKAWEKIKNWWNGTVIKEVKEGFGKIEEIIGIDLNRDGEIGFTASTFIPSNGQSRARNVTGTGSGVIVKNPTTGEIMGSQEHKDTVLMNQLIEQQKSGGVINKTLDAIKAVKDWFDFTPTNMNGMEDAISKQTNGVLSNLWENIKSTIGFKANGGVVNGSLFWAGESGAEFVGNIGSTSAVANTGQMTDAIYKAAYMGMSKALKENGGNGMAGFEPATTDDLFIAMRKKANNYNKMTGNSAFA